MPPAPSSVLSLLTGDAFSATRALELGLVKCVVPAAQLMPAAPELAQRILRHSPLAAAGILSAVTRGINASIGEGLLMESEQFAVWRPAMTSLKGWMRGKRAVLPSMQDAEG